jgi:hypothetical protein
VACQREKELRIVRLGENLSLINTGNTDLQEFVLFDRLRQMSNCVAYRFAAWTQPPPPTKPLPDSLAWSSNGRDDGLRRRLLSSGHYVRRLPAADFDHEEGPQGRRRTGGDGTLSDEHRRSLTRPRVPPFLHDLE